MNNRKNWRFWRFVGTILKLLISFKDKMNMKSSVVLLNLLRIALGNSAEWKGGRKRGLEEGDWAGTEARGAGYCF